jgi:acyl transferase domain-containing protein/surfactin synthase thioesterase subunit
MAEANTKDLLRNAALELRSLKAKIAELERARSADPTVIVGLGCRFPKAETQDAFWRLLAEGREAVTESPEDRGLGEVFDPKPDANDRIYTRRGSFVDSAFRFDPAFFGISMAEATRMDPHAALALQVAWEAFEDAGICIDDLRHARVGVFIGITSPEWMAISDMNDPYAAASSMLSSTPGRIAHTFGFRGPAVAFETACSSSLVAVHTAHRSLQYREIDVAIAGGVNLLLSPLGWIATCKVGALSRDGRCKTFDASADGYGRGEGCGLVVMTRQSDARKSAKQIHGAILGSATNHNGGAAGIMVPSAKAQEALIRQALEDAAIQPKALGYIEAHGTGTALGDPIEMSALGAIFGEAAPYVGTAKVNVGHLESAAGAAGLIRVLLSMKHGQIPPHIHLRNPNPHIPWAKLRLQVADKLTEWPRGERRIGGISSFGATGTNAHLIVGEVPASPRDAETPRPQLICLSARSADALDRSSAQLASSLDQSPERADDVAHTLSFGRRHWRHRRAILADSAASIAEAVRRPRSGSEARPHSRVCFLFPGQSSLIPGAGRALYERFAVYRAKYDDVAALAKDWQPDLVNLMRTASTDALAHPRSSQLLLAASSLAMLALLESCGIEPTVVAGHSIGEIFAAHAAGVINLRDAVNLVGKRASLMESLAPGGMLSAGCSYETMTPLAEPFGVEIAARNGPDEIVVSGPHEKLRALANTLEQQGIRSRLLTVTHAFHSSMMDPIVDELGRYASPIEHRDPRLPMVSAMHGRPFDRALPLAPAYWHQQLRSPVRFDLATASLYDAGAEAFIEVGSGSTLIGIIGRNDTAASRLLVPTALKTDECQSFLEALGKLYEAGLPVRIPAEQGMAISLPTSPYDARPIWKLPKWGRRLRDEPSALGEDAEYDWARPVAVEAGDDAPADRKTFRAVWNVRTHRMLAAHRVGGHIVCPAIFYLGFVKRCFVANGWPVDITSVLFSRLMILRDDVDYTIEVVLDGARETGKFRLTYAEAHGGASEVCTGGYGPPSAGIAIGAADVPSGRDGGGAAPATIDVQAVRERCEHEASSDDFYSGMWSPTSNEVSGLLRRVARCWWRDGEALAELAPIPTKLPHDLAGALTALIWNEAVSQVARAAVFESEGRDLIALARGVRFAESIPDGVVPAFAYAARTETQPDGLIVDIRALDASGRIVGRMDGLSLGYISRDAIDALAKERHTDWRAELVQLEGEARSARMLAFLTEALAKIVGGDIGPIGESTAVAHSGVDSFGISVFRKAIHESTGVQLAVADLMSGTLGSIAASVEEQLFAEAALATMPAQRKWIVSLATPKAKPRARILCFPGGGCGPILFRRVARELSNDDVEVLAVQLPGREARLMEGPATSLDEIRHGIMAELVVDEVPLVLVGHSMGASLAYDFAVNMLPAANVSRFISMCAPIPERLVSLLASATAEHREFIVGPIVRQYDSEEIVAKLLAIDMALCELLAGLPVTQLAIPATIFSGEHDVLSHEQVLAWEAWFSEPPKFGTLPCAHSPPTEVPELVAGILRSASGLS